jgi:hypothetical protein
MMRSASAPSIAGWAITTWSPRPSSSATSPRAIRLAGSARSKSAARGARLEHRFVQRHLAIEVGGGQHPEGRARPGERVELVEQAALVVVGTGRDPEPNREAELVGGLGELADGLGAALGVAVHRIARNFEREIVEVGVVVERGAS